MDSTEQISGTVASQARTDFAKRSVALTGGPVIEWPSASGGATVRFQATTLDLVWDRGRLVSAKVSGPVLRANGSLGAKRGDWYWFMSTRTGDWCTRPPEWVLALVDEFGTVPSWDDAGKEDQA